MHTIPRSFFLVVLLIARCALAEDWPCFRGPTRQGVSSEKSLPLHWSSSQNVSWKSEIPGSGWSSPIVWGERVFLTTATQEGASCHVLCIDRRTGKITWDREVLRQVPKQKEAKNSHATPTPVTDGRRVYAVFSDGSIVSLAVDGSTVWTNRDFPHYSQHGLGTSPILFENLLIMSRDGSSEGEDKKPGWQKPWDQSFLIALDRDTGAVRWKTYRGNSRIGHTTPIIADGSANPLLISNAGDIIQGFNPRTGEKIWWANSEGEGVVPSPVVGAGLVFTASGFGKPTTRAVRLGGRGDVTASHLAWEQTRAVSMIPSFVYWEGYLYTVTTNGIACCMIARTGDIVWQQRIGGNYSASPIYADGHIYFLSEEGETTVIEAGPRYKLVATNALDGMVQASMAVSAGQLFIRTAGHLYCIRNRD